MDIRKLTLEQRSSLVTREGKPFKLSVVSDDAKDPQPVKGFLKASDEWLAESWNADGSFYGTLRFTPSRFDLILPSIKVGRPVYLRFNNVTAVYPTASSDSLTYVRGAQHGIGPQAIIKIVNFDEVKVGDGLTAGTEPEYKLVPVVK